jgi:hypothetical protein
VSMENARPARARRAGGVRTGSAEPAKTAGILPSTPTSARKDT